MKILAIETSCDETSAAVVEDGVRLLSNVISSQIDIHKAFGGVVPEVASRRHLELVIPTVSEALEKASMTLDDVEAVACVNRPGLIGALVVGVAAAKAIALGRGIPLIGVHHLEGHIYANWLSGEDITFPLVCAVVSGGHSDVIYMKDHGQYEIMARTRDDAAGECFDKTARAMGLGYPGGPAIDKAAALGDPKAVKLPRGRIDDSLDFSFSGLKTAVIRYLDKNPGCNINDLAASLQANVVNTLAGRIFDIAKMKRVNRIMVAGGVAANSYLQKTMKERAAALNFQVSVPPPVLCTDNAAMVGAAAWFRYMAGDISGLDLDARASEPITG